ncbi:uncharacterized protein LOC110246907 [Exaiptasia diaphana]|uniref:Integrase core domain-containing protein n=1 Tax=Exaiptasia diaphana TaxID=2652724 RepID=A0A913XSC4_EXADI|nr:uncharacterized protein LOC110246907 [Exaiptasia diaphana]
MYAWSLRTLSRRLSFFEIKYSDYDVDVNELKEVVKTEMEGPGNLLGYRALQQKIREVHGLNVPRDLVYAMMMEVNPEGLKERGGVGKPKRARRDKVFTSHGSDWTMSLDGHDKLCGYQNSMFPLSIYGGQDTYSGRINFLKIWTTNSNPKVIGKFYLEYLFESKVLPVHLRIDRGTETDVMATMQMFLCDKYNVLEDPNDSVLYGPSTQNKIERWWRELLERLERFFKQQLKNLAEDGDYDSTSMTDRNLLAYVYIPVVQKELDIFRTTIWNNHRVRRQKNKELPTGVPEHMYHCPEEHGGEKCGISITEEDLLEVAQLSDVLIDTDDFLEENFRNECMRHIPNTDEIKPADAANAYLFLRSNFNKDCL